MEKYKNDHTLEQIKAYGTIGSIAVPLIVAVVAYIAQLILRRRDELLHFQLKTAEIVMDSRDTDMATRKAEFLLTLFPERASRTLKDLKDILRRGSLPYFGPSMERREELLRLLAQYPESRRDIIRAWEILFPWSVTGSNPWFESLKKDVILNRNKPAPAPAGEGRGVAPDKGRDSIE